MRTTLDLEDGLLRRAKALAAKQGKTLTAFIEEALGAAMSLQPKPAKRFKLQWKTRPGPAHPGIDLADRDSLYDAMDGRR